MCLGAFFHVLEKRTERILSSFTTWNQMKAITMAMNQTKPKKKITKATKRNRRELLTACTIHFRIIIIIRISTFSHESHKWAFVTFGNHWVWSSKHNHQLGCMNLVLDYCQELACCLHEQRWSGPGHTSGNQWPYLWYHGSQINAECGQLLHNTSSFSPTVYPQHHHWKYLHSIFVIGYGSQMVKHLTMLHHLTSYTASTPMQCKTSLVFSPLGKCNEELCNFNWCCCLHISE